MTARILMCPPDHYGIEYEINPWMNRSLGAVAALAFRQWRQLHDTLTSLGVQVELMTPQKGLPDLVFTANAGLVFHDRFISSRFRHEVRAKESPHFDAWFAANGFTVAHLPENSFHEGAGDALFCGVPYGDVDVDRLLHALTVLADPETGRREVGIHEKGSSAMESLLFSKYQMFRNVYWHHAVRAATALYKRLVEEAVDAGVIRPGELVGKTDEQLLGLLEARAAGREDPGARRVAVVRAVLDAPDPAQAAAELRAALSTPEVDS